MIRCIGYSELSSSTSGNGRVVCVKLNLHIRIISSRENTKKIKRFEDIGE